MKIIGLMLTWNNLEFFKRSVHQALGFCDELIVIEGCHSRQYPKHSTDGTCEYIETIKELPKLRVQNFNFSGRYDKVQRAIRLEAPKVSEFYEKGNWIFHWDDDVFFFRHDLQKMRRIMEQTNYDSLSMQVRHFFYNFRFNIKQNDPGWLFRIVEGAALKGISRHYYSNGMQYSTVQLEGNMVAFHYGHVKRSERMKARWVMSVEKGANISKTRFEKWMGVSWDNDEDIYKSKEVMHKLLDGGEFNVYNGAHPEILDNHPWRYIDDVRKVK